MRRLLLLALLLAGCADAESGPAAAVSAAEARGAVAELVDTAATRTSEAMRALCPESRCNGMSGAILGTPELAPGRDQPPTELCVVALPPTESQSGAKLVVLEGTRGDGRAYVTHVLVERIEGRPVVHEPGFWIGIRYDALQKGRSWSGGSDEPAVRERQEAATRRACTDTLNWVGEVSGT